MINKINPYLLIIFHLLVYGVIYFILKFTGVISEPVTNETVSRWDAGWYASIVSNGYVYKEDAQCNLAFFPLFPYTWKFLQLSPAGISVFNALILIISWILIIYYFKPDNRALLIVFSVPSLFFAYVPYAEALFYLSSVLLLAGYHKNKKILIIAGLLLTGLSRSVSVVFIPVIIFTELIVSEKTRRGFLKAAKNIMLYSFINFLSLFLVAFIQYLQTGKWFYFFEVQKYWNKVFNKPDFPLTTWDWKNLLVMDMYAFAVGAAFFLVCAFAGLQWLRTGKIIFTNKALLFSLAYFPAVLTVTTLFANVEPGGNSSVNSLNRYLFATAFFSVILIFLCDSLQFEKRNKYRISGMAGLLLFLSAVYILFFKEDYPYHWHFLGVSLFFMLTISLLYKRLFPKLWMVYYLLCVGLQIILFNYFLKGGWLV